MALNGLLLVNKPQGFTSHDVVAKLRGILRERRIGHGGTLDPMATGLLVVFVGPATRAADYAAAQEKEYLAGFQLGAATDTQDATGALTAQSEKKAGEEEVRAAVSALRGEHMQIPPMYSAVKINGQKLYDLARQGKSVERPARPIILYQSELLEFDKKEQRGRIRLCCSKGTYVRTVLNDLGETLGTYAHMTSLTRVRSGSYSLEHARTLGEIERSTKAGELDKLLLPVDTVFKAYPAVEIDAYGAARAEHGAFISLEHVQGITENVPAGAVLRVFHNGVFLMLGEVRALDRGGLAVFTKKRF